MNPRKMTSADIDRVRDLEGFPIVTDEAIIELSDVPYYTACPNPFIEEFLAEHGTDYNEDEDTYSKEPYSADVSAGKNDPIYRAHSYHTKVPHKAVMQFINHYTKPGDIVLDAFCGTGMVGVAARALADETDESVLALNQLTPENVGPRYSILCDLSPAATFIASQYNLMMSSEDFIADARRIIQECEDEFGWMFETKHPVDEYNAQINIPETSDSLTGRINYIVYSDVMICPSCGQEFIFWDAAVDHEHGKVLNSFSCPNCHAELKKQQCQHAVEVEYDTRLGMPIEQDKRVPVLINYTYAGKRYEKRPDDYDRELDRIIAAFEIPYPYPTKELPLGDKTGDPKSVKVGYVHQFYTKRNLAVLAAFASKTKGHSCFSLVHSVATVNTKMYRYRWAGGIAGAGGGPLSGTLYIPSLIKDINMLKSLSEYATKTGRVKSILQRYPQTSIISTQSAVDLSNIPANSCDYVFTDPPFGDNLMYSELSFLWEAWLGVFTNNKTEAIVNKTQGKAISDYQELMTRCFSEYYRVLKPNRWLTVEFHNSKNAVWNAIQTALQRAGFVVADVRTIDKKQVSFNQGKSAAQAIKQDLVISAYKPSGSFSTQFECSIGTEESAWAFVNQHLMNIPIVIDSDNDGKIDIIVERQAYLLFDRMVAYHVMKGIPVPLDAADFYRGLDERYLKRDDMYFLPDQVTEYDTARMKMDVESVQFALLVTNEKTAIGWLYQLLANEPMTYQQIQPKFMQEIKTIDRYEAMPELAVLLEENFLQDENGHWYVPDTKKEGDIAKLREKSLLREFDGYLKSKGKLKLFRSEAIRVGFSHLWKDKNYQAIVDLANRLPAATIQEDPNLLMYYDISLSRVG